MVSIRGYGSYVPLYRIERSTIAAQHDAHAGGGETAVPAHDEDVTSLGVHAAKTALSHADIAGSDVDVVYAATTSDRFDERGVAPHVAHAVGAERTCRVGDFQGSARAASNAVLAARDAVDAGRAETALVVASDVLDAEMGSSAEQTAGAGAGALLLGDGGEAVAELADATSATTGFVGRFKEAGESPVLGDGRFNRRHYLDAVTDAASEFTAVDRAVFPAPDGRWGGKAASALDLDAEQSSTFQSVGYAGAGGVLLDLAAALDDAESGESVLLAAYGPGGCDALTFDRTSDSTPDMRVQEFIDSKEYVPYGKHRANRGGVA